MDQTKIAAVVVWYNPDDAVKNIETYIGSVSKIYVVDNSDTPTNTPPVGVEYIAFGQNKGIATALNVGARRAIQDGYEWLLTMDQDSCASDGMVEKLYEFAVSGTVGKLGIAAAQPDTPTRATKKYEGYTIMESVITSGNMVNLDAYKAVDGFVDKLFIDMVDCVFSLAIRAQGYKIVQVNEAVLSHALGEITPKSFLGIKMFPTHHSLIRWYYISRNRLYMHDKFKEIFPAFIRYEKRNNMKMWIKAFLYEKDKLKKWKITRRGRKDYRCGVFGKFKG